jgi:DNA-binding transcriptional MerR regulator
MTEFTTEYTIKDLEQLSGIKAHTIRIWEQRYSFLKPKRTDTNIRTYNDEELKKLLIVALLNKHGFKISRIDKMNPSEMNDAVLSLSDDVASQDRRMNKLIFHMIDLNMDEFERVLDKSIAERGIDQTILQLVFPYLERIGVLWLTSHINPAQEHFVSNIIRQKILVGINSLKARKKDKSAILYLPEGELHELGLLYIYYALKRTGITVFYLGANLPVKDLLFVAKLKSPEYIFTHLTTKTIALDRFILSYKKSIPAIPLVITGKLTQSYSRKNPAGIIICKSLEQLNSFILSL